MQDRRDADRQSLRQFAKTPIVDSTMESLIANSTPVVHKVRRLKWFLEADGYAETWRQELLRLLPYGAAYALLHGLFVAAGFFLSEVPEAAVAIWPAVGLLCAVLATTRRQTWPLWIACSVIGRIVFELLVIEDRALAEPLMFSIVNAVEALVFAVFMQRPLIHVYRYGRPLYLSVSLTVFAAIAASAGGILGAVVLQRLSVDILDFWNIWRLWSAGDFVGMILIIPVMLWQLLPQIRISRGVASWSEIAAMPVALLLIMAAAIYFSPADHVPFAKSMQIGLVFFVALPVLWAALRAEFRIVAGMQLLLAVVVIVTAAQGLGPLGHTAKDYLLALAALQLFLILTMLVATMISSVVLERERAQRESVLHQRFSDLLVQLTEKLIGAGAHSLGDVIVDSLRLLGGFASADRCVLMQMDNSGHRIGATHSWQADGVDSLPPTVTGANLAELPWASEQLRTHGYVLLRNLDTGLPKGAEELEAIRQSVPDTIDAIYIGLFADERIIGLIGYGYMRRGVRWSSESISLMYLVGQMFASILQRKKVERDLESYRDSLRRLAADMAITEERARRRTATDLHDGIAQNLAVARMKIGQVLASNGNASQDLEQARNLIDDALRGTRYLIADLSPSILYELGLVPALQALAERFEPANELTCTVDVSGDAWSPHNDTRISLYRAVQECLNNVARHAQAQSVNIRVAWHANSVHIEVIDDGVGFNVDEDTGPPTGMTGFGLFSMRENLALLGGSLEIESARGLGTTVRLVVNRRDSEVGQ